MKYYYLIIILLTLNNCTVDYNILVHKDGSAHISHSFEFMTGYASQGNPPITVDKDSSSVTDHTMDLFQTFYTSDQISNFKKHIDGENGLSNTI